MKPLLIIGSSSFGQLVSVLAEEAGQRVEGFIDDFNCVDRVLGGTHELGTCFKPEHFQLALAIGYKHLQWRLETFQRLASQGFAFPSLIHPTARISPRASIGAGCMVMANVDIDAFTRVEELCVLWPQVTISHDNVIGQNTFVSPSATLCGFVTVGDSSFIGANSTITDGTAVPAQSFIKAASRYNSGFNSNDRTN